MGWLNLTLLIAFVLHLINSVTSTNTGNENKIKVTTNGSYNYPECVASPKGCSLTAALRAVTHEDKFKNSTTVEITSGNYTLNTSFVFQNIDSLTIAGVSGDGDNITNVNIQCSGNNSGLAFIRCRNITISGVSLISCGTLQNSSSYNNPLFYSALFIKNNTNFKMQVVVIQKSLGIGVTMYDTTGEVIIDSVTFKNNGPKSLNCPRSVSKENSNEFSNIAKAGGGLYIEFTYGKNEKKLKNSIYKVLRSTFKGNVAPFSNLPNTTFKRPGGIKHIGFSRGGGLSVYFRGSAEKNMFFINSCVFEENQAFWGGGYFIQFLDVANGNNISITNTNVTKNTACFGGGAFQLSIISSVNQSDGQFIPNNMLSTASWFSRNSALSGGGGSIFGRTSVGYVDSSYYFNNCTWKYNKATTGFALTLKLWDYDQGLFGPNSPFKVKLSD